MNACALDGEDLLLVYVTVPTVDLAKKIAAKAVDENLAACANILPEILSVYRWQGQVEQASETPLLLKTKAGLFEPLSELVRDLHPHDCPCIIGLPVANALPPFAQWIHEQTR